MRIWESKKTEKRTKRNDKGKEVNFPDLFPVARIFRWCSVLRGKRTDIFADRLIQCIVCYIFNQRTLNFVPSFLNCHWRISVELAPPYYISHFDNRTNFDRPTHGKWSIRGSTLQTFQTTWLRDNTRRTEKNIWETDRVDGRSCAYSFGRSLQIRALLILVWLMRSTLGHVRFLHEQSVATIDSLRNRADEHWACAVEARSHVCRHEITFCAELGGKFVCPRSSLTLESPISFDFTATILCVRS